MSIQRFTVQTDLNKCTYDHHIEMIDGKARLKRRLLIADDIGAATSRTFELIKGNTCAKKIFILDSPNVTAAELVIRMAGMPPTYDGEAIIIEINGHAVSHRIQQENSSFQGKVDSYWTGGWQVVPVPPEFLKAGENEIVIRDGSGEGWCLYIDNNRYYQRSLKSIDGGKTWTSERIGRNDFCQGEYIVRLNLKRYAPEGWIMSPAIDIASLSANGPICPEVDIKEISIEPKKTEPEDTALALEWRSGSTPSHHPDTWNSWMPLSGKIPVIEGHRFLQWRAILKTTNPQTTPELHGVTVKAKLDIAQGQALPTAITLKNEQIVRSLHPFAHQLADEPRLAILRERWRLDKIVAGAKTEFDKILRLKRWTRQQWEDGWNRGPLQFVPQWDALLVLELAAQQLTLGMCTHYASTFVECCLALGLEARVVIISSHCVGEVWSNDYKKWVLMDPGCDTDDGRKGTRHFERYGVPMSALDLHKAHVNQDFNDVVECNDPEKFGGTLQENISLYRQFCIVLRNNFLTSLYPEEPEHGAMSYTYDGHLWYESNAMPLPQFSMTSRRDGDFHWTLNQTEIYLKQGSKPNTLDVLLDTVTPNFATYLVQINDGDWKEETDRFVWTLSPGTNTLRAKTRSALGIEGIESSIVVNLPHSEKTVRSKQ